MQIGALPNRSSRACLPLVERMPSLAFRENESRHRSSPAPQLVSLVVHMQHMFSLCAPAPGKQIAAAHAASGTGVRCHRS